jgi:uncharacterized membrane protein YgdD (TMEM256/DUF423 family)
LFVALFAGVGALLLSASAWAHHGDAGRYIEEPVDITGTVVEMQLVNPHAVLVLDVTDANGKTVRWQAEMGSVQQLTKLGFAGNVKIGANVTLTGRRLKSGAPYMNLTQHARVILADSGKVVLQSPNYEQPAPTAR